MQKRATSTIVPKPAYVKGIFVFSQKIRQSFYINFISLAFPAFIFFFLRILSCEFLQIYGANLCFL